MGTKLRRIQVSLPDDLADALADLADAEEKPISKIIVALLDQFKPQIPTMAEVARSLKAGNRDQAIRAVQHLYGDALADLIRQDRASEQAEKTQKRGKRS